LVAKNAMSQAADWLADGVGNAMVLSARLT